MYIATEDNSSTNEIAYFEEVRFGSLRHIYVLMFVVVVLCSAAILYVLRPSSVVFAQGPASENSEDIAKEFIGLQETGLRVNPIIAVKKPAENADGIVTGTLSSIFTPEVRYWESQIMEWSEQYSIDPNIIATIMQIESCGNPSAVSYAGANGLFQVMPFHFQHGEDRFDPNTNAMRGLAFFKEQMRYTGGNIPTSFAGYNGGYAASGGAYATWPSETQRYFYWAKGIFSEASLEGSKSETLMEWLSAGGSSLCAVAALELGIQQ